MSEHALVIINPSAGRGKGHSDWSLIASLMEERGLQFRHRLTTGVNDAGTLAKQAVEEGYTHLIAVGGDGTFSEVAHGILSQQARPSPEVRMSAIPVGTGNDWCRMYGIPPDYRKAVDLIAGNCTLLQDAGLAEYERGGVRHRRYFINVAGIGMDARVVFDTNRRKERGSAGKIAYLNSLLSATFSYKALPARIRVDGQEVFNGLLYSANFGICRYSGGGMQQVPGAVPDDGLYDITVIRKVSKLKVMMHVKDLYDGSFVKMKEVATHRGAEVVVESDAPILLEADGESLGGPPFIFSIRPGALRISASGAVPDREHANKNNT